MTATIELSVLREAMEKTGNEWLLNYWGEEAEKHLKKLAADLGRFQREYKRRFKETPDVFALVDVNPPKAAAFFHLDSLLASREMKILIWRLMLGVDIDKIDLKYKAGKVFALRITLIAPYDVEEEAKEEYVTTSTSDFRVLRHFGLMGVEGGFEIQGYYGLKGGR